MEAPSQEVPRQGAPILRVLSEVYERLEPDATLEGHLVITLATPTEYVYRVVGRAGQDEFAGLVTVSEES